MAMSSGELADGSHASTLVQWSREMELVVAAWRFMGGWLAGMSPRRPGLAHEHWRNGDQGFRLVRDLPMPTLVVRLDRHDLGIGDEVAIVAVWSRNHHENVQKHHANDQRDCPLDHGNRGEQAQHEIPAVPRHESTRRRDSPVARSTTRVAVSRLLRDRLPPSMSFVPQ